MPMTWPQRSATVPHDDTRPGTPVRSRARRVTATRARPHKPGSRWAPTHLGANGRMAPSEHSAQTRHHIARRTRRFRHRARPRAARRVGRKPGDVQLKEVDLKEGTDSDLQILGNTRFERFTNRTARTGRVQNGYASSGTSRHARRLLYRAHSWVVSCPGRLREHVECLPTLCCREPGSARSARDLRAMRRVAAMRSLRTPAR